MKEHVELGYFNDNIWFLIMCKDIIAFIGVAILYFTAKNVDLRFSNPDERHLALTLSIRH